MLYLNLQAKVSLAYCTISGNMSFGVSIGDFIAVGELVVKIIDTLHGTQPEYQELSRELEGYVQSRS